LLAGQAPLCVSPSVMPCTSEHCRPAGCSSIVFERQYGFAASASIATSDRSYGCHFGFCLHRADPRSPGILPTAIAAQVVGWIPATPDLCGCDERRKTQNAMTRRNCDTSSRPEPRSSRQQANIAVLARIPMRFKPLLGRSRVPQLTGESQFPYSAKVGGVDCYLDTMASASGCC
jgi:hypothetical protein